MGLLSAIVIEVEGPMAGKASYFKGRENEENDILCVGLTIDKLIQCLSLWHKMH